MGEALRLGTGNQQLDAEAVSTGRQIACPHRPGVTVAILPAQRWNPRYRKAQQAFVMKQLAAGHDREQAEEEFPSRFADPEFVVDALVADIEGIYNGNGKKVQYTRARGVALLGDPGNADVLSWIVEQAMDAAAYYTTHVDEVGNS